MLSMSDTPIADVLRYFADRGIGAAFLVPTPTGYEGSIVDAIAPFRSLCGKRAFMIKIVFKPLRIFGGFAVDLRAAEC